MIRKATTADVKAMHKIINEYASQNRMLARSLYDLYEHIRDFHVYVENNEVKGCCALHVVWEDLAEVKALAVASDCTAKGIGKQLVLSCLAEAKSITISRVFALTYVDKFFLKLGFELTSRDALPHKVWSECINCPKFPDCDEIAVIKNL